MRPFPFPTFAPKILAFAAALASVVLPLHSRAPSPLDALVEEALRRNPGLAAQRAKVEAARKVPSQRKALPDPMAELEAMNFAADGSSGTRAFTRGISVGVVQPLPFPGKRALAAREAQEEAGVEESRLRSMEWEVRSAVLGAAIRYRTALDLLEINEKTEEALRATAEGALARYAAGGGNQGDVLLAQASVTKVLVRRTDLERQKEVARARLESLLGGPVDESLLHGIELASPTELPPLEELLRQAGEKAPRVETARAEAGVAQTRVELAKKNFQPDFLVGGRYRYRDMTMGGRDFFTVTAGVTLPLFHRRDRYRPGLEEALFRKNAAGHAVDEAGNEARYALAEAYQGADRNRKVYGLYEEGLLLQAQQAYEASLSAYRAGRSDFGALLMALADRFAYEEDWILARGEYHQRVAEMEAVLGRPLFESAPEPPGEPQE